MFTNISGTYFCSTNLRTVRNFNFEAGHYRKNDQNNKRNNQLKYQTLDLKSIKEINSRDLNNHKRSCWCIINNRQALTLHGKRTYDGCSLPKKFHRIYAICITKQSVITDVREKQIIECKTNKTYNIFTWFTKFGYVHGQREKEYFIDVCEERHSYRCYIC